MSQIPIELKMQLIEIGLSNKEADVYLALLSLGSSTVSKVSREAGILRTTTYAILDSLFNKGLVSLSGKEPKQEYIAEGPDAIKAFIERSIEDKKKDIEKVNALIPQLKSIHAVAKRPRVMFYEGLTGLEHVYEDTLTATEPIKAYANVKEMHSALPSYFPRYYERRTKKGITIKAIIPANDAGIDRAKEDATEGRESALVPEKYYFSPEINIYDNKVMIASWKEKLGIIIESQEIADAMKTVYELAWAEAKRLEKEI